MNVYFVNPNYVKPEDRKVFLFQGRFQETGGFQDWGKPQDKPGRACDLVGKIIKEDVNNR